MGWGWDDSQDAYNQVQDGDHEAKFSHELIAGAAAFEGFKAFENHQRNEGKPVSHQFAKEMLAGFAGAEVDKLAETKGMDEYDRIRAREHAERHTNQMYDDHYVNGQGADQYDPNQYNGPQQFGY